MHDPTMSPLISEIERLQEELERANMVVDDQLGRLGDAGVDAITVAVQLEDAKSKIVMLEEESTGKTYRGFRENHWVFWNGCKLYGFGTSSCLRERYVVRVDVAVDFVKMTRAMRCVYSCE